MHYKLFFIGLVFLALFAGCFAIFIRYAGPTDTPIPAMRVFMTQQECEVATGGECSYSTCDYIPPGKTLEEVCGNRPGKGWTSIRPQTFDECVRTGNPVTDIYPRECRTHDGLVLIEKNPEDGGDPIPNPVPPEISEASLKFIIIDRFGPEIGEGKRIHFCDPDFYPVARVEEIDAAKERFPEIMNDAANFHAVLSRLQLDVQSSYDDAQTLRIYQ